MLPVTTPGAEIVFEGTCNFRELGGYRAADGRHVRRGLLYRGCSLDTLQSPADRTKLESLHLREILDLRSAGEAARQPDAAVSGAHYQRICGMRYADGSEMDFSPAGIQRIAAEKAAYEAKAGHPVHDFYWFTDLYKQMPFGNPAYHELFRLVEEHRVPLLFHCTCGKDRTGIAAMLVLLALGVSREDAIADYMLTNVYRKPIIDKFMQDKPADQYDLLLPVEGVSESMGAGSIDVLLEKYPSYEAYFEAEYGLTTARLAALRDFYLE